MPTEQELRSMLSSPETPAKLDAATIIRKSKARRRPARIAVSGAFALAIAGIGVVGVSGLFDPATGPTAILLESVGDEDGGAAPESATGMEDAARAPADTLNQCGAPVAAWSPGPLGVELVVDFPSEAPVGSTEIAGTVTLVNNGEERLIGTTAALPSIALAAEGVVVWHSTGVMTMQAMVIDLEPGEVFDYPASITPVQCADDPDATAAPDSPPLEPGSYSISAAIDFVPAAHSQSGDFGVLEVFGGPLGAIELR